jgi:hypothetical protein
MSAAWSCRGEAIRQHAIIDGGECEPIPLSPRNEELRNGVGWAKEDWRSSERDGLGQSGKAGLKAQTDEIQREMGEPALEDRRITDQGPEIESLKTQENSLKLELELKGWRRLTRTEARDRGVESRGRSQSAFQDKMKMMAHRGRAGISIPAVQDWVGGMSFARAVSPNRRLHGQANWIDMAAALSRAHPCRSEGRDLPPERPSRTWPPATRHRDCEDGRGLALLVVSSRESE